MRLSQAPGGDHLDPKARLAQLLWPGSLLEEDDLELMIVALRAIEDSLQHRLGAAETIAPRHRDEYAHVRS
jgi:hypothetical protein